MRKPIDIPLLILSLAMPEALFAQPKPAGWPLGARIPAISGQVIDAITGKPVANVDVTLRATMEPGSGGATSLRYENDRTASDGRFTFPTSLESAAAEPFASMKGYWLTINQTFWSIESMKAQNPYDEITWDSGSEDISGDVIGDPLFNKKVTNGFQYRIPGPRVNNKAYFPMAAQFVLPCRQVWNANCIHFDDAQNLLLPLIPALDSPEDCHKIPDPAVAEQCRQLNTYRAAFRHVETIAQVRVDKGLCRKVDQGPGTKACLESLASYIQNPDLYENRLPLRMETEIDPIEKVLILAPLAGMSIVRPTVGLLNPFRETAHYGVCYAVGAQLFPGAACVSVWWVHTEEDRRYASAVMTDRSNQGVQRVEVIDGNRVTIHDLAKTYHVVWSSGSKVVNVTFYRAAFHAALGEQRARAAEASPEMRRELLRQYLFRYPSR